jgi:hypothetical protein
MDLKSILGKIAPALGAAFGGPIGGAAGTILSQVLLGRDKADEAELTSALAQATPEQIGALRKADQDFQSRMRELDIDVFKIEMEDRASARQMYAVNYWPQIVLSSVFTVGYVVVMCFLLTGNVPNDMGPQWVGVLTTILGVLTAAIPQILGFWFGSSFGSREKTAALAASKPADTK